MKLENVTECDSSDEELDLARESSLYEIGSRLLNNNLVKSKYHSKKVYNLKYKSNPGSKILNKFLIGDEYTDSDILSSVYSLNKENKDETSTKVTKTITEAKNLYNDLEKIACSEEYKADKGRINTKGFKCFKALQSNCSTKEVADTWGIKPEKVKNFLEHIDVNSFNEILLLEKSGYLFQFAEQVISTEEEVIVEVKAVQNWVQTITQDTSLVDLITEAKNLYNDLEKIACSEEYKADKGRINTKGFKCFKALQSNCSTKEVADTWGIKPEKVKNFLEHIDVTQNLMEKILSQYVQANKIFQQKLETIVSTKTDPDWRIFIDLFCNAMLADVSDKLSKQDRIISDDITKACSLGVYKDNKDASEFLANSLIYQKHLRSITKFIGLRDIGKDFSVTNKIAYDDVFYIDTISKFSTGLKRSEKLTSVGTYDDVANKLKDALSKINRTTKEVASLFQDVLKGKKIEDDDASKVIIDIAYLLFSCEPNRNPSALITNAMFLELVAKGIYQLSDMSAKMPMAMKSEKGKPGPIEVGRFYHEQFESSGNKAKKNDYGKSALQDKSDKVIEFLDREYNLLCDYFNVPAEENKPNFKEIVKSILVANVNKVNHSEYRTNNIDKTLNSFTIDWSNEACINDNIFKSLIFNKKKVFQDIQNDFNKKKNKGTQESHKFFSEKITKILNEHIDEIEKLVQKWYLPNFKLKASGEQQDNDHFKGNGKKHNNNADDSDDDNNHSNNFDHKHKQNHGKPTQINTSSHNNPNKYCSILVEKYKNYEDNTSEIIDIQFQPLDYETCTEIDNEAQSKLQWIIDHKDPASRKRSYYEAFPEELHYSNIFEKRLKLSEYEVIKIYHIPYCFALSESFVIERLINREFLFDTDEYHQYNSQHTPVVHPNVIKKAFIDAGLRNKDDLQFNSKFDKWCKTDWDSTVIGAYKHFSQTPSNITQEVYKPMVEDIHVLDNAANKANSLSYQYQCSDIRYVGKQLFDNLKENIDWIGDVGEGHEDLDASNLLPEKINKPVVGVYNIGNYHWIGFSIKKIGPDFLVFYKDSLNNKEIDESFKKLISERYAGQGEILYFSHSDNEQTESKKTACGVFALKNAHTIATKLNLNELGANKETCEGEFENIEFTKQEGIPALRDNYGNLYALEFTTQLQNSYKTNIIKEIIRASHDTDIEALIHSIKEKLQGVNCNDMNIIAIKGNEVFDNYKSQTKTIGIEVYLADQNLLSLENYRHYVQIHFSEDIDQSALLYQLNDLNLQQIALSNLWGIIHELTEKKQDSLSQAKLQSEQYLLEEAIQKKIESDIQEALGQPFNAKSFKVEKSIMTKKYHVEKEIQPLDGKIKIEILAKTLDAFLKQWKLEIEAKNQIKGMAKEGLTSESIKINLDAIIQANQDNAYFYISPKIMEQKELLSSISDWQNIPSTYYGALIKLENASGDKHAVLFYASKAANHLAIRITDPLSQEASTFKLEIENLAQSLRQEGMLIEVVYSGKQNENYGTCADMSLIMLQEIIGQAAIKPILDNHNQATVGKFDKNYITYDNAQLHNDDYEKQLGGDLIFVNLDE